MVPGRDGLCPVITANSLSGGPGRNRARPSNLSNFIHHFAQTIKDGARDGELAAVARNKGAVLALELHHMLHFARLRNVAVGVCNEVPADGLELLRGHNTLTENLIRIADPILKAGERRPPQRIFPVFRLIDKETQRQQDDAEGGLGEGGGFE